MVKAATECAMVCTTCADACLEEPNPAHMRLCIRNNQDCADLCALVARLIARPGPQDADMLHAVLTACATMCRTCATECATHGEHMEHCRICAEVCRDCADACDRMKAALER